MSGEQIVVGLTAATLGIGLVAGFVKIILRFGRILDTIEGHTKQLTTNGGEHLADVVRATKAQVDGFEGKWDERQTALDADLVVQQDKVADALTKQAAAVEKALKKNTEYVEGELKDVWKALGLRDINRSTEHLLAAADRAEAARPQEPK